MFKLLIGRLAAYFLDIALLYVVFAGGLQVLTRALFGVPDWGWLGSSPLYLEGWVLLTISVPTWTYFILSDLWGGRSIGKRLFGLQTTATSGEPVRLVQAFARTALKLFPWELTHFSILVPVPLWNPDAIPGMSQYIGIISANLLLMVYLVLLTIYRGQRSLHDILARTMIVVS